MKKIIIFIIIYIFIFSINVYSKYKFEFILECYDFIIEKDEESPSYNVFYSTKEWTNTDVTVQIKFSEEIKELTGFKYADGAYIKQCTENESKMIIVEDLAGNKTTVKYQVNNIDKKPPIITGIENNSIYNITKIANYVDKESGIYSVEKIFYGDLLLESYPDYYSISNKNGIDINKNSITLKVTRAPKNIVKYRYYRIDGVKENYIESNSNKMIYKNNSKKNYKYYVIGIDDKGISYKSNIIERSSCCFDNIILNKNTEMAEISISGIDTNISNIKYEIIDLEYNTKKSGVVFDSNLNLYKKDFNNSNKYKINLKFYSETKISDERCIYINLNENFKEEDNNTFSKNGNYDIKVKDKAGNEILYTITMNIN